MSAWQSHITRLRSPGERRRKAGRASSTFDAVAKKLQRGAVVVDVGCGESGDRFLAKRYGFEAVGLDLFPVKNKQGFIQADCSVALPFISQSIDAVISHAMLTLLPPSARWHFYDEVARVLKPGGYFSFTTYMLSGGFGFSQIAERAHISGSGFHQLRAGVFQRCETQSCRNHPSLDTFDDVRRVVGEIGDEPQFLKTGAIFLSLLTRDINVLTEFTGYEMDDIGDVIDGMINAEIMLGEHAELLDLPWLTDYENGKDQEGMLGFTLDVMAINGEIQRVRTDTGPMYSQ